MASEVDHPMHNGTNSKFLKMDVIEMTLLLKSIGFRLNSIDFDDRGMSDKKSNENGHDNTSEPDANSHSINVRITCSKSKMVSNLSYKYIETPISTACTCPKREIHSNNNNSFWEVQSSGTFANKRRSIGALVLTPDDQTSSNLLPALSPKSVTLTQVLMQVLLCQYEHNTKHGEFSVNDIDIKSIMMAVENGSITRKPIGDSGSNLTKENVESLPNNIASNGMTPKLANNGQSADEFGTKNAALNETINTDAFSSPKSHLITSSPNGSERSVQNVERDANIINNLNEARNYIDRALLFMKLNVTRNLTHDATSPTLLTVTPDMRNKNPPVFFGRQNSQPSTGQNTKTSTPSSHANKASSLSRRASIGGTTMKTGSTMSKTPSANGMSAVERRASLSKLSLVRRAVSGIGNRTIGGSSTATSTSSAAKVPIQPASKININARTSSLSASMSRRIPGRPNAGTSNTNSTVGSSGLLARKATLTARIPAQASKLAKK